MIGGLVIDVLRDDLDRLLLDVLVVAVVVHLFVSRFGEVILFIVVLHRRQKALHHAQDLTNDVGLKM
jgi:hypothetical protein